MPRPKSANEAEFLAILKTPADERGRFRLGNLNYSKFSHGLTLYIGTSLSNERSRTTHPKKLKIAQDINDCFIQAQSQSADQREGFLYEKLTELLESGKVKRFGLDNNESQLYQLINGYLTYYYTRVIIPNSTPENVVTALSALPTSDFSQRDKAAVKAVLDALKPFLPTSPEGSSPAQAAMYSTLLRSKTRASQDLSDGIRDQAVQRAYAQVKTLLAQQTIKNSLLLEQLSRFARWYELELENYSYSQKALISQLRLQAETAAKDYADSLQQKTSQIGEYHEKNTVLTKQVATLQQQQKSGIERLRRYKTETQQLTEQKEKLQQDIEHDLALLSQMEAQLTQAQQQLEESQAQLQAASASQRALQSEILSLQKPQPSLENGYVTVKDFSQIKKTAADEAAILQKALADATKKAELLEDVLRERDAYREQVTFLAAENEAIKRENAELNSVLQTLKLFLKSVLRYFNCTLFSESKLKDQVDAVQLNAVDRLLDWLSQQVSQLPVSSSFTKFPTKPPLIQALPVLQALNRADNDTQRRLLQTYPGQISHLLLKLIGKAMSDFSRYDEISIVLKTFADQVGQDTIIALKLFAGLDKKSLQDAKDTLYHQLFGRGSNEPIAKERLNRLTAYGIDYHTYLTEKNKHRAIPAIPSQPPLSRSGSVGFFPAIVSTALDQSTDELDSPESTVGLNG